MKTNQICMVKMKFLKHKMKKNPELFKGQNIL